MLQITAEKICLLTRLQKISPSPKQNEYLCACICSSINMFYSEKSLRKIVSLFFHVIWDCRCARHSSIWNLMPQRSCSLRLPLSFQWGEQKEDEKREGGLLGHQILIPTLSVLSLASLLQLTTGVLASLGRNVATTYNCSSEDTDKSYIT